MLGGFSLLSSPVICRTSDPSGDLSSTRTPRRRPRPVHTQPGRSCKRAKNRMRRRIRDRFASSAQLTLLLRFGISNRKLLQTHPSLVKRIKALEPTFDGTFPDSVGYVSWDIEGEPYSAGYTGALPPPPSVDGAPKRRQAPSKSKDPSLSEVFARKKRERENAEKRLRAQHEINRPKLKIAPSL